MNLKNTCIGVSLAAGLAATALAQEVDIKDAWVRLSVPGQRATGAFMTLTARESAKLIAVASPVAGVAEVHQMKMEGDIMRMRAVQGGLDLPAGVPVTLKPGGYHVMLMDLKESLAVGRKVSLTLTILDTAGAQRQLEVQATVAAMAPAMTPPGMAGVGAHRP